MGIEKKPDWLNPADYWVNVGEKNAPVMNLPDGKVLGIVQKRNDVTPQSIVGRLGIVGVMNYTAPPQYMHGFYHAVDFRQYATSDDRTQWTRDQMRTMASVIPLYPIEGNDFGEGSFSINPGSAQALWFYEKRKEMYEQAGAPFRVYGHHANDMTFQGFNGKWFDNNGGSPRPDSAYFRNAYASVEAARAGIPYFSLTTTFNSVTKRYEDICGVNIKHYAETPDYARAFFGKLYAVQRMGKGMGKVGGLGGGFLVYNDWSKMEGVGNSNTATVGNGLRYRRRIENPAGYAISEVHPQVDFDWQVGMHLICGLMYGSGTSTFDVATQFGENINKMSNLNVPGPGNDNAEYVGWESDVPNVPAPVESRAYPTEPNRWHDAPIEAAHFYSKFNRTAGEQFRPLAYRFDGSEQWIEPPADGASILEHASAFDTVNADAQGARRGRPAVEGRFKGTALDAVAFDASRGKMYSEKIFFRGPNGAQYPSVLRGCIPNVHTETIA
ncbi:MAG TPA: hypothetical protein VGB67_08900 [Fibrella sp.]|jgi:hypothetical protein